MVDLSGTLFSDSWIVSRSVLQPTISYRLTTPLRRQTGVSQGLPDPTIVDLNPRFFVTRLVDRAIELPETKVNRLRSAAVGCEKGRRLRWKTVNRQGNGSEHTRFFTKLRPFDTDVVHREQTPDAIFDIVTNAIE